MRRIRAHFTWNPTTMKNCENVGQSAGEWWSRKEKLWICIDSRLIVYEFRIQSFKITGPFYDTRQEQSLKNVIDVTMAPWYRLSPCLFLRNPQDNIHFKQIGILCLLYMYQFGSSETNYNFLRVNELRSNLKRPAWKVLRTNYCSHTAYLKILILYCIMSLCYMCIN